MGLLRLARELAGYVVVTITMAAVIVVATAVVLTPLGAFALIMHYWPPAGLGIVMLVALLCAWQAIDRHREVSALSRQIMDQPDIQNHSFIAWQRARRHTPYNQLSVLGNYRWQKFRLAEQLRDWREERDHNRPWERAVRRLPRRLTYPLFMVIGLSVFAKMWQYEANYKLPPYDFADWTKFITAKLDAIYHVQ